MKVYEVVSELLHDYGVAWGDPPKPPEDYCIAELVVAGSRGQAKWLAWKMDRSFSGIVQEMPRFTVHVVGRNAVGGIRVVTRDPRYQDCWDNYGRNYRV